MHRHKEGGTETYTINDIRAFEDLFGFAVSDATQGRPAREARLGCVAFIQRKVYGYQIQRY